MIATMLTTLGQGTGPVHSLFFDGAAAWEKGRTTDSLFMWIFWFSTFWFVLLMGLMFYWVIKYRRRPGVPAASSRSHNTPLEVVWTVVPSLFLAYIFFRGFHAYIDKLVPPADAMEIVVRGMKWEWIAMYPTGAVSPETTPLGARDVPVIVLPAGRAVRFKMYSDDVIHSFWIPDFRMKFDVMPNRYTSFWIEPQEPGEMHWVFCAEYCGDLHSEMAAMIYVMPEPEFNAWLEGISTLDGPPWEVGQSIARRQGCFACHSVDGTRNVGPSWKNVYGNPVPLSDGREIPGDDATVWDNYIRKSILDPDAEFREGYQNARMNSFQGMITEEEILYITAYIRSLSDHPLGKAAVEAEYEEGGFDETPDPEGGES